MGDCVCTVLHWISLMNFLNHYFLPSVLDPSSNHGQFHCCFSWHRVYYNSGWLHMLIHWSNKITYLPSPPPTSPPPHPQLPLNSLLTIEVLITHCLHTTATQLWACNSNVRLRNKNVTAHMRLRRWDREFRTTHYYTSVNFYCHDKREGTAIYDLLEEKELHSDIVTSFSRNRISGPEWSGADDWRPIERLQTSCGSERGTVFYLSVNNFVRLVKVHAPSVFDTMLHVKMPVFGYRWLWKKQRGRNQQSKAE